MSKKRRDGLLRSDFIIEGKRYYVYGHSEKELQEKEFEKRKELELLLVQRYNPSIKEYYEKRIEYRQDELKPNTVRNLNRAKNSVCKIYMDLYARNFGEIKVKNLLPEDLRYIQLELQKTCKTETVNNYMSKLKHVISDAVREGLIVRNPFSLISGLKRTEEKARDTYHRALSVEEQKAFFNSELTKSSKYYNVFCMAINSGLRIGELCALKYRDLKPDCFTVQRTVTRINGDAWGIGEDTKTKSGKRTIPITDEIRKILDRQKKINQERKKTNILDMEELVFTAPRGGMIYDQYVNEEIKRICKHEGIDIFTTHAFRDTFATRAIESGMNPKTLQEILGHKDYAMTMNLYAHVLDETKKEEMNRIRIMI